MFTCASCADYAPNFGASERVGSGFQPVKRPDSQAENEDNDLPKKYKWLDPACTLPPMPFLNGQLSDLLLDVNGVSLGDDGQPQALALCKICHPALKCGKTPH